MAELPDSGEDFEDSPQWTTQRRRAPMLTAVGRLNAAINLARQTVSSSQHTSFASELGNRFPFASSTPIQNRRRAAKRRKASPWKVVPCCLSSPSTARVPIKGILNQLCKHGLGTKWFCKEDQLEMPLYLTAEEVHYLICILYPPLKRISYEFCKASGPGNNVIVPLIVANERFKPGSAFPFLPYFDAENLKSQIGRKGRLYIRPMEEVDISCLPIFSDHEVCHKLYRVSLLIWNAC